MNKNEIPSWAANVLLPTFIDRVDMCPEGCNSEAFIKLIKSKEANQMSKYADLYAKMTDESKTVIDEHIEKEKADAVTAATKEKDAELQKTKDELAQAKKEAEDAKKNAQAGASEEDQIQKALESADPVIKALFQGMQAQQAAAQAALKIAKEKEEEAIIKEKIKGLEKLGVPNEQLVSIGKSLNKLDTTEQDAIYSIFKSICAQGVDASQGKADIYTPIGKSIDNNTTGTNTNESAWSVIEKEAEAIMKDRKCSREAATTIVMKEKPELYSKYLDTLE